MSEMIFVGLQIRKIIKDHDIEESLNEVVNVAQVLDSLKL